MCKVMGSKITLPLCPEFQWVGDEFMTSSFTTPSDKVSRGSQANRIYLHASGVDFKMKKGKDLDLTIGCLKNKLLIELRAH